MTHEPSRQSFLGEDSDAVFARAKICTVGASGGGSHFIQQISHVGIVNHVVVDPKHMEAKHSHRLVGSVFEDIARKTPKAHIAERLVKSIQPAANVEAIVGTWQESQLSLRSCTAIVGCVDSYSEREQLERFSRRFLIPYIDVGMGVLAIDGHFHIHGQVALSSAGHACLRCMGIITEDKLKKETEEYGAAGPKAQVIWPNAILASTAVGLLIQLLCPWDKVSNASAYLEYNGNVPSLVPSPRMEYVANLPCPHYPSNDVGDPLFELPNFV